MRFAVRYCTKCERFVLIEDNKHTCRQNTIRPLNEQKFERPDRVTRVYYSMEDMVADYEKMKTDMPCPICGTPMPYTARGAVIPLIQVEGRFE